MADGRLLLLLDWLLAISPIGLAVVIIFSESNIMPMRIPRSEIDRLAADLIIRFEEAEGAALMEEYAAWHRSDNFERGKWRRVRNRIILSNTVGPHPNPPYVSPMSKTVTYLVFIIATVGIGILIGYINLPGAWYQSLAKPPFNPPNWLFGPAWTILYILIGIAGARTWLSGPGTSGMKIWFGQMLLNYLWSPFFFGFQKPLIALVIIVALLASIIAFIANRWGRDRSAALLFVPYALWVAFATLLNASLAYLN